MGQGIKRWSTSRGWQVALAFVAVGLLLSSMKLAETASARGWFTDAPVREARIESQRIVVGDGDPRLNVGWVLPGENARGSATLEIDERAPLPTSTPVIFDRSTQRWSALEEVGHNRGNAMLDVGFVAIELWIALWCLVMIYVRDQVARAPREAVIDREALAAVAKQRRAPWIALRAAITMAFYAGVHLLSLTIVSLSAALLWVMIRGGRFNVAAIAFAAFSIYGVGRVYLSSSDAGGDEDPGVRLRPEEHPAFFAELASVAAKCGTTVPDEVFMMPGRNAGVSERSRLLGLFPGRRTLLLGMTLVYDSTVSELRAVLAHEFGHFVGGDTRLGGLVYAVRSRVISLINVMRVSEDKGWSGRVAFPYERYLEVFLFVTRKLSRAQELLADKLSIAVAGREAHISELKKTAVSAVVSDEFWRVEVEPLIADGMLPKDVERGEVAYERRGLSDEQRAQVSSYLSAIPSDPFDTHPALAERIAFAELVESEPVERDDRPALSLFDAERCLDAVSAMRRKRIEAHVGRELREVPFDRVFEEGWLPFYQRVSQQVQMGLPGDDGGVQGLLLIADPQRFDELGRALDEHFGSVPMSQEDRRTIVRMALHARLVTALLREPGASARFELSQPLRIVRANGDEVNPVEVATRIIGHPSERASIVASLAPI